MCPIYPAFSHTHTHTIRIQGVELMSCACKANTLQTEHLPGSRRGVFEQTVLLIEADDKLGRES